ncbi:MAG TPA: polyphosphate kinase 2 family protein [Bryobacteraceae bacterium]|nr:polyphosphate kinase 2 family protein [Bryobacteraceae bacterium]
MHGTGQYRVKPGHPVDWAALDPDEKGPFTHKEQALEATEALTLRLDALQERLYAEHKRSLLIVLQALDTGGKDGTIRHVMRGANPQGCQVTSFKVPTDEERSRDFLWRVHPHVPPRGYIGIFNRSHYEDVIVTRVHKLISDEEAESRFGAINNFERLLSENGTTILKFYLAISRDEQRRRLQARLDDPEKRWKFSCADLTERRYWNRYPKAYAEAISATSTKHAPWYLIPANHKTHRNYLVAKIIVETLETMDPQYPVAPDGVDYRKVKIGN